jgi:hypothetical protein
VSLFLAFVSADGLASLFLAVVSADKVLEGWLMVKKKLLLEKVDIFSLPPRWGRDLDNKPIIRGILHTQAGKLDKFHQR